MRITLILQGLTAAELAALLQLPCRVAVDRGGVEHDPGYTAQVELEGTSEAVGVMIGALASSARNASATEPESPRGWIKAESELAPLPPKREHTAPELDGRRVRVFTFGPDHRHPRTGESLAGRFARIPGDARDARERVLLIFGRDFTTDYDPATAARMISKYDLNEINPRPVWSDRFFATGWGWVDEYVPSVSERRFTIVQELGEAAELEPEPSPDPEDTEAAMARAMHGPTQVIPTIRNGGPA